MDERVAGLCFLELFKERRDTAEVGSGAARNLVFHWNGGE
jgi:hypothetical protein